ncbi:hypothetical protein Emag_005493 [Eimeria magna]
MGGPPLVLPSALNSLSLSLSFPFFSLPACMDGCMGGLTFCHGHHSIRLQQATTAAPAAAAAVAAAANRTSGAAVPASATAAATTAAGAARDATAVRTAAAAAKATAAAAKATAAAAAAAETDCFGWNAVEQLERICCIKIEETSLPLCCCCNQEARGVDVRDRNRNWRKLAVRKERFKLQQQQQQQQEQQQQQQVCEQYWINRDKTGKGDDALQDKRDRGRTVSGPTRSHSDKPTSSNVLRTHVLNSHALLCSSSSSSSSSSSKSSNRISGLARMEIPEETFDGRLDFRRRCAALGLRPNNRQQRVAPLVRYHSGQVLRQPRSHLLQRNSSKRSSNCSSCVYTSKVGKASRRHIYRKQGDSSSDDQERGGGHASSGSCCMAEGMKGLNRGQQRETQGPAASGVFSNLKDLLCMQPPAAAAAAAASDAAAAVVVPDRDRAKTAAAAAAAGG